VRRIKVCQTDLRRMRPALLNSCYGLRRCSSPNWSWGLLPWGPAQARQGHLKVIWSCQRWSNGRHRALGAVVTKVESPEVKFGWIGGHDSSGSFWD
jgi:hypothetical protein